MYLSNIGISPTVTANWAPISKVSRQTVNSWILAGWSLVGRKERAVKEIFNWLKSWVRSGQKEVAEIMTRSEDSWASWRSPWLLSLSSPPVTSQPASRSWQFVATPWKSELSLLSQSGIFQCLKDTSPNSRPIIMTTAVKWQKVSTSVSCLV